MNRLVVVLAVVAALSWVGAAQAQCCGAPAVSYYAPAPTTVYYPAPTAVYYAPQTVFYAPAIAPVVTTRYRPILGGTVTRVRYPWAVGYYPYW
jgi:hypothetical protein